MGVRQEWIYVLPCPGDGRLPNLFWFLFAKPEYAVHTIFLMPSWKNLKIVSTDQINLFWIPICTVLFSPTPSSRSKKEKPNERECTDHVCKGSNLTTDLRPHNMADFETGWLHWWCQSISFRTPPPEYWFKSLTCRQGWWALRVSRWPAPLTRAVFHFLH